MRITYSSYSELLSFMRGAFKGLVFGLFRTLWAIILFGINTAIFAYRKAVSGIKGYPVAAVIVLLFILAITNLANYANMKVKLTTAEWRYDQLQIHMDSVYEAYNIHKTYSRLQKYN